MRTTKSTLSEKEMELAKHLIQECRTTGGIQEKLKRLFAGTIEQMLEEEMEEHQQMRILGFGDRHGWTEGCSGDLDLGERAGKLLCQHLRGYEKSRDFGHFHRLSR